MVHHSAHISEVGYALKWRSWKRRTTKLARNELLWKRVGFKIGGLVVIDDILEFLSYLIVRDTRDGVGWI
jgi:hypothetical protein